MVGQKQGHRPGLIESAEIPEIAVLAEGVLHVGVVGHQGGRRDHRRGAAKTVQKAIAAVGEAGGIVLRSEGDGHGGQVQGATGGCCTSATMAQPIKYKGLSPAAALPVPPAAR